MIRVPSVAVKACQKARILASCAAVYEPCTCFTSELPMTPHRVGT